MLVTQFDKFVNRSTQEILGSEIEQENLKPMLSSDIVRNGGNVTGVKGNAEIYYRTGNVNLTPADLGALDSNNIYNELDETSEGYALDARQGKALNDAIGNKLDKANVYNGLDKTEAGYALDARQGKALNDKINATQSDIAIIIEGNHTTHTGGVAVGEYVIVRNSTISGITDGLYKAAQAIPANTTITSAYLAAVDGGGMNNIKAQINSIGQATLLGTTASVITGSTSVEYSDAKNAGYHFLLVVIHAGSNPTSTTWLSNAIFPINAFDIHTGETALIFVTSGGATYSDIRVKPTETYTSFVLDSKSKNLSPYGSVYGIK